MTTFKISLLKSDLIPNQLASTIGIVLPLYELLLGILLIFLSKHLKKLFFISLVTLSIFTIYYVLLQRIDNYNGCSCGGIFDTLNFTEHLSVNIFFIIISFIGIILKKKDKEV